jgi:uncharacterized DUF497 family protein
MDEYFELNGIGFLWDRAKARENLQRHGVSFEQASEAFFDPFLRVIDAGTDAESRDALIGMDTRRGIQVQNRICPQGNPTRAAFL